MIGWNSKIGPWCRVEGSLQEDDRNKKYAVGKFEVCVLGVGVIIEPEVMIRNCLVMPFITVKENNTNRIIF